ncbi:hypothetical protein [Solimicrobium silvestre]|uniref:Lipoprotein n=1 Tax=Solimicrobium silvestre TaxID=2099400 RepID=A0A2S9H3Q8_9BURK|nr:hypothetical protein [Solimicrobium silvestre]PRC94608.1 hypothetical protein S2091_0611 [Solimicrobium silvestre]
MLSRIPTTLSKIVILSALACASLLLGCDKPEATTQVDPEVVAKENDARATGSACRQAGRALEDCYSMNPTAPRAAVFSGWKDMNDYMRENKMEVVKPEAEMAKAAGASSASATDEAASASASSSASGKGKKK